MGPFAADPGTVRLVGDAVRGEGGILVCALPSRGLDELVGILASRRQMTRVTWLRHLTAAEHAAARTGPLVLIGQPAPDETVNGLGPDLLVGNGVAADRDAAVQLLLRLAPLTVAASVLRRPDPATCLLWSVRAAPTRLLLP